MRLSINVFSCLMIAAAAVTGFGQKSRTVETSEFKQLGGASEEIRSMRLPDPATTGQSSKAAMIPVREGNQSIAVPVESADGFQIMLIGRNGAAIDIKAVLPNGERFDPRLESAIADRIETTYGFGDSTYPAEVFRFGKIGAGTMRLELDAPKDRVTGDSTVGYLVISSDSPYRLYTYVDTTETVVGNRVGIVARMFEPESQTYAGTIDRAEIELRAPSGAISKFTMFDDGNHADGLAGDGVFGGTFIPRESGDHVAQISAKGTTAIGEDFLRTAEHIFTVAGSRAQLSGDAFVRSVDDTRVEIDLPATGIGPGQKVLVHSEIWGSDSDTAVTWIGGMAVNRRGYASRQSIITVSVDLRWLIRSAETGGFELRNLRIQNPDGTVTLGTKERIALPKIEIPDSLRSSYFGEITDEMRFGRRPVKQVDSAVGGKLMLIHGYCSGGNTFPTSQFSNNIVFNDPNQNRTHDQFANLIKNFGAAYPSFGAVAHSQGGAATLHLYTYYWSGLDYATGPGTRLIQSVGTPYQGTALAGNLALLGQIFGAGCGSNSNLSYSGAATWLSGIPTWARAKVSYHTTSFTDVWWRYDYCNLATDPFLSDPEDGVVERSYAQLSGAINLGHKTGWCHTSGMRDPAQTGDSSRNSNMNSNAMR